MKSDQQTLSKKMMKFLDQADSQGEAAFIVAQAVDIEIGSCHTLILERQDSGDLAPWLQGRSSGLDEPSTYDIGDLVDRADNCFGVDERNHKDIIGSIPFLKQCQYISCNIGGTPEDPRADLIAIVFRNEPPFADEDRLTLKTILKALHLRWERLNWNDRFIPKGPDHSL